MRYSFPWCAVAAPKGKGKRRAISGADDDGDQEEEEEEEEQEEEEEEVEVLTPEEVATMDETARRIDDMGRQQEEDGR